MGIFSKNKPGFSRDGGKIGNFFSYSELRNPFQMPVSILDLIPSTDNSFNAGDEFFAKFRDIVSNNKIDDSVYNSWAKIQRNGLEEYKNLYSGLIEESRFLRAAMTGYLMAVTEKSAFLTFKKNQMASYLPGAMLNYIINIEAEFDTSAQIELLTGLYSGYHKAHTLYKGE